MNQGRRVLLISSLGNALELYDFGLYGIFAATIAETFFPASSPTLALLATWATFSTGFIIRPLGALAFGIVGDKVGRKAALTLSILAMGLPTLVVALLPSFAAIGVAAPIILVLCRLLQGLSVGGEYNGAAIYALEHQGGKNRGLVSGVLLSAATLGILLAGMFAWLAELPGMPAWTWRVAFALGFVISLVGFSIRRLLEESPEFAHSARGEALALKFIWRDYWREMLLTFSLAATAGSLTYVLLGYLGHHLQTFYGVSAHGRASISVFAGLVYTGLGPLAGMLYDRLGARLHYGVVVPLAALLLVPSSYGLFTRGGTVAIAAGVVLLAVQAALTGSPHHAFSQDLFPTRCRYRGIGLSYSLGMGLLGGTTTFFAAVITTNTGIRYSPAVVTLLYTLVFFLLLRNFHRQQRRLKHPVKG